ncbi:ATP-binding response regulator [Halobaculum gomorrense]|uniref:histidine kinase n=1 Tax=Halobaculum gomorrense TaxID=43928 RepID=A0A1M5T4D1_9EURY|nr:response regulator [Halobaculum gomorrense]SHH45542.1 Signal transduction histidine kinase [Halobaculum gomorrense]
MADALDAIRVFHIDDDPEFAELVATFLEREHDRIEVRSATDAEAGLDVLAERDVDCIVSDHDMPGRDGIEFLRAVREEYPDLPFLLFTGKGSEEIASDAISAGVTDYIQKGGGTDQYALLANRVVNAVEAVQSRRMLTERTRRLETLIGNLPGIVYRCRNDPGWPMKTVDGEVEPLTGYTAAELEADRISWGNDIVHPDEREAVWDAVQNGLATDSAFEVTYRIRTRDGDTKWVWELDEHDRARRLRESHDELRRQNERLEEFVSVVSHDLRNPLNVATGRLDLARDDCDSEQLDAVKHAHDRMEALIEDLLALAREGEAATDLDAVDPAAMVRECWTNVETVDASLAVEFDGAILADERRLRQLFENLVRNAVEHGGDGVTVTIGELDGGFFLEDDGVGIPADRRESVFEAGYSTSREGTGFGLRIVKQVVEAHGWEIRVTESRDGGARFEVTNVAPADE